VRAVALQHDGELKLGDNAPGLVVWLRLPLAGAAMPFNAQAGEVSLAETDVLARSAS
jgi:hypothetical protein